MKALAPRDRQFLDAYLVHGCNASAAYRACGFKGRNADVQGFKIASRLKPEIERRQGEIGKTIMLSTKSKLDFLEGVLRDPGTPLRDRFAALKLHSTLSGEFTPEALSETRAAQSQEPDSTEPLAPIPLKFADVFTVAMWRKHLEMKLRSSSPAELAGLLKADVMNHHREACEFLRKLEKEEAAALNGNGATEVPAQAVNGHVNAA